MLPVRHFNFIARMLANYLDVTGKPVYLIFNFKRKTEVKRKLKDL